VTANFVPAPPTGLVIALQFWDEDMPQAMRLARLLADIETERRDVTLAFCPRFDVKPSAEAWEAQLYCGHKFHVCEVRSTREGTGHPAGPNALWSGVMDQLSTAWQAGRTPYANVLTIEADGCPLRADWLDVLIGEHEKALEAGKRITGPLMQRGYRHINGTLMMHLSTWFDRPSLHRTPSDQAWDLFHAAVLTAEARPSAWMKNVYGAGNWSGESLRAMSGETAWLSSCKDDSAIRWAERALVERSRAPVALLERTDVTPPAPPPVRHYATSCPASQVPALFESMERHCKPFVLHVLALDWDEKAVAPMSPRLQITGRDAFLGRHPGLFPLPGPPRNGNETACSTRWTYLCDVMEDTGQPVTLIDGDLWFWSSPEPAFAEIGDAPCAVSPHGFPPLAAGLPGIARETHAQHGVYNGGWTYFAGTDAGRLAARYMATAAHEWCYLGFRDLPDGRRAFGDQTYLEDLVEVFGAHVIAHPGVNLGPWGVHAHTVDAGSPPLVDGRPLVAYHYSSLRPGRQLANDEYQLSDHQLRVLYLPYLEEIGDVAQAEALRARLARRVKYARG
jgi:hypothetical protein